MYKLILFFLILLVTQSCNQTTKSQRAKSELPNIIFILSDDLGYGDLACYGHPYAKTPNLDKLAEEGLRLTRFYAAGTVCSPSRAAFMTGKHPATFDGITSKFGFKENSTITELLKTNGYVTGHFGKWHLGPISSNKKTYGLDTIININPKETISDNGRDVKIFNDALDFMNLHSDQPFYINIWTHMCHYPIHPPENLVDMFRKDSIRKEAFSDWMIKEKLDKIEQSGNSLSLSMSRYLAEVYALDIQIGRIVNWLKDNNLEDNTIIVFSSDHGPAKIEIDNTHPDIFEMVGYAGELRGGKGDYYEGGTRVPFIIKWPSKTPANRIDSVSVVSALDWLPTICKITNTSFESNIKDGKDVSAVWFGNETVRETPLFWRKAEPDAPAVILDGNWKLHQKAGMQIELYNLQDDISERNNVADLQPEVVAELQNKIKLWETNLPTHYKTNPVLMIIEHYRIDGIVFSDVQISKINQIGKKYGIDEDSNFYNAKDDKIFTILRAIRKEINESVLTDEQKVILESNKRNQRRKRQ